MVLFILKIGFLYYFCRYNKKIDSMCKKEEIPFHHYSETVKYMNTIDSESGLCLYQDFPFILTQFEIIGDKAQATFPHRHDHYEIIFLEDAAGEHIIDCESYQIKSPVFYFLSKGQIHFWKLHRPLIGTAILFPREFLIPPTAALDQGGDLTLFNGLSTASHLYIKDKHLPNIREQLHHIKEEYLRKTDRDLSMLKAHIHILLVSLFRIYAEEQNEPILNNSNAIVRQFRQLVAENYLQIRSVQEYANLIKISSTHLRESVKRVTGYSPGQLIRQEIIFEAKRKLANTHFTTAEIGYSLHFEDTSYFSRFFKRETGESPSNYRKEIRKKYQITL